MGRCTCLLESDSSKFNEIVYGLIKVRCNMILLELHLTELYSRLWREFGEMEFNQVAE